MTSVCDLKASLLVSVLLFTDGGTDLFERKTDGRDGLAPCPEVFAGQVALTATALTGDRNGAFPFEEADHGGHRMRGWHLDAHMHVIRH